MSTPQTHVLYTKNNLTWEIHCIDGKNSVPTPKDYGIESNDFLRIYDQNSSRRNFHRASCFVPLILPHSISFNTKKCTKLPPQQDFDGLAFVYLRKINLNFPKHLPSQKAYKFYIIPTSSMTKDEFCSKVQGLSWHDCVMQVAAAPKKWEHHLDDPDLINFEFEQIIFELYDLLVYWYGKTPYENQKIDINDILSYLFFFLFTHILLFILFRYHHLILMFGMINHNYS